MVLTKQSPSKRKVEGKKERKGEREIGSEALAETKKITNEPAEHLFPLPFPFPLPLLIVPFFFFFLSTPIVRVFYLGGFRRCRRSGMSYSPGCGCVCHRQKVCRQEEKQLSKIVSIDTLRVTPQSLFSGPPDQST